MEQEFTEIEVLHPEQTFGVAVRAEIDSQIATAKQFPRDIEGFMKKALAMVTVTEEVAQSCIYAKPRGGKVIKGPSVRLAEIVAHSYGNLRVGSRIISTDGKQITAQGVCHDLENNVSITLEVSGSILQNEYKGGARTGRMIPMNEDMKITTANKMNAIAYRNAVFKVVPSALVNSIYNAAISKAEGSEKDFPERLQKALNYAYSLGINDNQIVSALNISSISDIKKEELSLLRGMFTLISNGENTVEDLFPDQKETTRSKVVMNAVEKAIFETANKKK